MKLKNWYMKHSGINVAVYIAAMIFSMCMLVDLDYIIHIIGIVGVVVSTGLFAVVECNLVHKENWSMLDN